MCGSGHWEVTTRVCGPSAAVETWRKDNPNPDPGTVVTVIPGEVATAETLKTVPEWWLDQYGGGNTTP